MARNEEESIRGTYAGTSCQRDETMDRNQANGRPISTHILIYIQQIYESGP